jgi:hypothetical protein
MTEEGEPLKCRVCGEGLLVIGTELDGEVTYGEPFCPEERTHPVDHTTKPFRID